MPTGVFVDEERWIGDIVCCFVSLMSDVCAWRGLLTLSEDETDKSAAALNHITAPWRSAFCHLGEKCASFDCSVCRVPMQKSVFSVVVVFHV